MYAEKRTMRAHNNIHIDELIIQARHTHESNARFTQCVMGASCPCCMHVQAYDYINNNNYYVLQIVKWINS